MSGKIVAGKKFFFFLGNVSKSTWNDGTRIIQRCKSSSTTTKMMNNSTKTNLRRQDRLKSSKAIHLPKQPEGEASISIQQSVKDLTTLFEIDSKRGMDIAKLMSHSARKELSDARRKLTSSSGEAAFGNDAVVPKPSTRDLRIHALTQGIPFIGFGLMDNAILIWAGDQIDTHLGVMFGISTLCAAAIGNIISDIAGVGLGAYIEDFCSRRLRLPKINLSNAQRQLRSVRLAGQMGNCIGLTIGCIIGMFPLLLIDSEQVQKNKKRAKIFGLFQDVMGEAKGLVGAESTCLFLLVDDESGEHPSRFTQRQDSYNHLYLYGECTDTDQSNNKKLLCLPVGRGLVSKAVVSGDIVNVANVRSHPDYDPEISIIQHLHKDKDKEVKQMICVPVRDMHGNTIAVIQATNKKIRSEIDKDCSKEGFTGNDEQVLQALATHISVSLQNVNSQDEASLKEIIQILKEHGASDSTKMTM